MSKRQEIRERKQREQRQQMLVIGGIIVILALAGAGWLIYQNYQSALPVDAATFTTVPTQIWPQADGKTLGSKTAPVVVEEFADFQCPVCAEYFRSVEPQIIKDYVETGKIRYEFHHFIVIDGNVGGTESRHAAEASECANEQGHFWDYHKMLYTNQKAEGSGAFADNRLKAFAPTLGLDSQKFNDCFNAHRYAAQVNADVALGAQMGVSGTPTLFINGAMAASALNYPAIKQQLDLLVGQ